MNHWLDNSAKNLLPLSKATEFTEALREWYFTGDVDDYEGDETDVICELCEHPDLVHHFHIRNSQPGHSLLVGSSCILKFNQIAIRDESGKLITEPSLRKAKLNKALKTRIIESALAPLRQLWKKDKRNRNQIEYLAQAVKTEQGLEPKELLDLLADFDKHAISCPLKSYKVSLRSDYAKMQIAFMSVQQFERIRPALSVAQFSKARMLRHEA